MIVRKRSWPAVSHYKHQFPNRTEPKAREVRVREEKEEKLSQRRGKEKARRKEGNKIRWKKGEKETDDLELDTLPIQFDGPDLEINADSGDKGGRVGIVAEAQEQTGFTYTRIADEE